ncbi:MAG: dodecin domain-containing protein [Planctomycetaceae bacterium]|nr:dodecin domain-containing protein [Planctomycetaceae bacterium]
MKDKAKKTSKKQKATNTVARVTEVIASSPTSFDDAVQAGIERACQTLENVTGAWVQDQKVDIQDGKISSYRVTLKITFVLND